MEVRFSMLEQQEYIGTYIGGYRLTAQLSTGSSSYTFLGETASQTDQQCVVIKWYNAVHLTTQQEKKDFLCKASRLKHLQQPFILPILATGLFIDTPYVVTPYMSKGSLHDRMHNPTDQAWLQEHAISIIQHISQALAYSHQQNVVHGKLHPGNILFNERDEVQLTDFQLVSLPNAPVETASMTVNRESEQKVQYYPGVATQNNDYHALGNIAHELFIRYKSSTNQTLDILSHSLNTTPPITDGEPHSTPVSHTEEVSVSESSQPLLSALDIPTEKRSSIVISDAEVLPMVAAESSSFSTHESSTQTDAPMTGADIDTHTSMETPPLPPTPPPGEASTHRDTIKNVLMPTSQYNDTRGNLIRRLLRDQGSLFLVSGILCIVIFSIIGTLSPRTSHRSSLKGQRTLLLNSTAVGVPTAPEIPKQQPILPEKASTKGGIYTPTSKNLLPHTKTPVTVRYGRSTQEPTETPSPKASQDTSSAVTPTYWNKRVTRSKSH